MKHLASAVFFLAPLFCGAFPQDEVSNVGVECYKCNSKDTPDCAQNPTINLKSEYCTDPYDKCIVAIVDSITHRGCEKEVNAPSDAISKTCIDSRCNDKLFPNDRLKCYQCNGKQCIKDFQDKLKPCVNYDKNDYCITDVIDEIDVIRGCQSDPDYLMGQFVEKCKKSSCNDHPITTTSECIACAEANSTTCVKGSGSVQSELKCTVPNENTCKETLLLNRKIECFTYVASNNVIRGCVKEAGDLALDSGNFKTCNGQLCNNECLFIKCVKCNSASNPKCGNQANKLEPESCLGDKACFTAQTAEDAIVRGCGEQLANAKQIATCHEDGCNNEVYPPAKGMECYQCNSKDLVECATHPSAHLPHAFCKDPSDKCVSTVVEGVTYRGCGKEVHAPSYVPSDECNSSLCNVGVYPKDRLQCYQCEGKDCVKDFKQYLQPCADYDDDKCLTVVENESNIIRKCSSDPVYSTHPNAVTCEGSACNNQPPTYSGKCLSCSQTNATSCVRLNSPVASGDKCTLPSVSTCTDTPLLNRPISCYTYKKSGEVVRGCTKDAGDIAKDVDNFSTCEGPMCNNDCLPIKCVSCDSKVDPRCANKVNELGLLQCTSETACYVGETPEGATIRGCGAQSIEAKKIITSCFVDGCNNEIYPPAKGMECYQCNSKDLVECATHPSAHLPHAFCKDPSDKCLSTVVEGVTYRGCGKEVHVPPHAPSEKCQSSLCNLGVYPKDRLQCYQCEGMDCVKDFKQYLQPCADYGDDKCLTVVENESNIIRKCSSDPVYSTHPNAVTCEGSACNNQPATYSGKCLSCSQTNATSCVRLNSPVASGDKCTLPSVSTCTDTPLLNRPISCYTYKKSGEVVRGCTKDAGDIAKDVDNFSTCEGPMCNNDCLPIKCVSCDSKVDPRCANKVNELGLLQCTSETACYVGETPEGATIRGCGAQSIEAKKIITSCFVDGCNNEIYPPAKGMECYQCNSKDLVECATHPSAHLPHAFCKDPSDKCLSTVVEGVTYRGCGKEVYVPSYVPSDECNSSLCNVGVYPKDRLQCYQCEGKDCVKDFKQYLQPCADYDDDKCLTVVENESNIIRKCSSDPVYSTHPNAVTCEGSACNNQPATYSGKCLSCSQTNATSCVRLNSPVASGDKCTLPSVSTCTDTPLLNRPISCYTYKKSGEVVRGCTKDAGDIAKDVDNFSTCEGPMCNNDCLPIKCVSCDSKVDPRCANKVNELGLLQCTSETACYVGETPEGATIRGCGAQSTEAKKIITSCYVDGCNNEVYPPAKGMECYQCNSKDIVECATHPSAHLPHAFCKDPSDKCVSTVVEGVTYRGCGKEVHAPSYVPSDECNSSLCNVGVYPKDRLQCYQCEGKDCVKDFKQYLQPCADYDDDKCLTVVENESNIIRKCSSDPVYSTHPNAVTCEGSACNNQPATYSGKCLSCSQTTGTSCVRINRPVASGNKCTLPSVSTCTDTPLLNRPISCYTYKKSGEVVRGCTKDAGSIAKDVDNFSTCEGPMCNNNCLPIKCVSCDSKVDPRCVNQVNELGLLQCTSETACYVGETPEGATIRGCGAQSTEAKKIITSCYVDGCNNEVYPPAKGMECYQCNSKDLSECATRPSAHLPHAYCKDPSDKCVSTVVKGITYRGCGKEVYVSPHAPSDECNSSLCNVGVYPKNRLQCYQCEGKDCVKDFKQHLKPCVNYMDDKCLTVVESETNIIRKCSSDPVYSSRPYAVTCAGSGCNNQPATYSAQCLFCSGSTDTDCARSTSTVASGGHCTIPVTKYMTCTDTPLLNRPVSCFTYTKSGRVTRGCTRNINYKNYDLKNFKECKGSMCNNECLPINCISCNSKMDLRCISKTNELQLQKCSSGAASCFYGQTADGEIIRGCGHQSTEVTQINTCSFDGCNSKVLPPINTSICVGSNCNNNQKIPCTRGNCNNGNNKTPHIGEEKHCYQCKDDKNCRNTPDKSLLKSCASPTDGCFQYVNLIHEMVRGCKSDNEYKECLKMGKECLQCSGDGCNNVEATKTADLSCLLCDSSDTNCLYTIHKDESMRCHPTAPFYVDSFGCYSCLSKDNKTASRGCYYGETYTSKDDSTCNTCTSDDCNDKSLFVQSCLQCNGDDASCNGHLKGTLCKESLYSHNLGCYAKKIGNNVKRGCTSDLVDPNVCAGNVKFCHYCLGQDCNTSGTGKLITSLIVFLAPILVSLCFTY